AGLAGDPDRVQAAIEALKAALDGTSGNLADHQAADPAHPAAKISFDNSSAGLPGSPDRVQGAIEAMAGNASAYAAAQVKTVKVEAISTTELKISKGVVSLPELGDDQVTNGDFETGDTTGWTGADATLAATGGAAQSGSYGLEVTATADGGSAQALITVEPEKFYHLSAHLKSSASGHQVRVTVRDQDHGVFLHQPDYEDLTDYSQRQALVFIPPGCTQVRLDLQVETSAEVGWFDNVGLEPVDFTVYHVPEEIVLNPTGMTANEWQYVMAQKPASGMILSAGEITITTSPPVYSADRTILFDGDQRCLDVVMASGATTLWPNNIRGDHFSLREVFQAYELQPAASTDTLVDLNLPALGKLRVDVRDYWYPQTGSSNCLLINGDDTSLINTLDDVGRSSDAVRQAAQPPMETDQEGRIKYKIEGTGTQCIIKIGWVAFELPLALRRR
ncbi:MAG: carbohydrate binding domain-containing protein, partial [Proteobacteria bacterium]|nr:carbohydrate binding domain-containing protein [Pseudomonadota bacterium]